MKHIKLLNFRNYNSLAVELNPYTNLFTGLNGAGKTSLLDTINYLSLGKSGFAGSDKETLKTDEDFFRIEGKFIEKEGDSKVVIKYNLGKKALEVNAIKIKSLKDFIGTYPSVCISPKDILIIIQGSQARRKFIDQTLSQCDKNYLNAIVSYRRLLKQRNELLKKSISNKNWDMNLFQSFTDQMMPLCKIIYDLRTQFVEAFNEIFVNFYTIISNNKELPKLEYFSQIKDKSYEYLMEVNWDKDKITGKTSIGIHKDDLKMYINNQILRTHGSQGQQKTFLLALKLAQYEWLNKKSKQKPLLLLDDIYDKLDSNRVQSLLMLIHNQWKAQMFITDTDKNRVAELLNANGMLYKQFEILNGEVR